eukprot:gene28927-32120_t
MVPENVINAASGLGENRSLDAVDVALLEGYMQTIASEGNSQHELEVKTWNFISRYLLRPSHSMELRQHLASAVFQDWPSEELGPWPLWSPTEEEAASTNAARFLATFKPDQCRWLPGCRMNIAHCALHSPRALPHKPALLYAEEGTPEQLREVSMDELRANSLKVAAGIRALLNPGEAVAVDMPMTVHAIYVYLGIILSGCVVVSIADSFAPHEIESRLRLSGARLVFTQEAVLRDGKAIPLFSRVTAAHAPTTGSVTLAMSCFCTQEAVLRDGKAIPLHSYVTSAHAPTTGSGTLALSCFCAQDMILRGGKAIAAGSVARGCVTWAAPMHPRKRARESGTFQGAVFVWSGGARGDDDVGRGGGCKGYPPGLLRVGDRAGRHPGLRGKNGVSVTFARGGGSVWGWFLVPRGGSDSARGQSYHAPFTVLHVTGRHARCGRHLDLGSHGLVGTVRRLFLSRTRFCAEAKLSRAFTPGV